MAHWMFQFLPNERDVVAVGYRMDATGEALELEVNAAIRYPLKFHKVSKIVVALGPAPRPEREYIEVLGVGKKQWPMFDLRGYVAMAESEKIQTLRKVTMDTFAWLEASFDDADFATLARNRLKWAT